MFNDKILPEGMAVETADNAYFTQTDMGIEQAFTYGYAVEGIAARCDAQHNLYVRIGEKTVFIPRDETAMGISEGIVRDIAILSRVGKAISFIFTDIRELKKEDGVLYGSRRLLQERTLRQLQNALVPGDIIDARVTHLERFGCFVDLGRGCMSMIGADRISVSRINHSRERFTIGQKIKVIVTGIDRDNRRILLSHKELLGTWKQNADLFSPGETVEGIVRGVESYGTFIELTPNLSGLAEPMEGISNGDRVSVFVKSICSERMKVKLLIIDTLPGRIQPSALRYFIQGDHMDRFCYAPSECTRPGTETLFSQE